MPEPQPADPGSRFYMSQRLRLHYVDWGNAGAPPLLLLHGGHDHCRTWDRVARALRDDFHILAPDLRGHGDSAWSPDGSYTLTAHVYDLAQLIHTDALAPLTIVAHSLGAMIALRYAGTYPENVSRLVAIEGIGLPRRLAAERAGKSGAQKLREWIEAERALSGRQPRRYASIDDAAARMREANRRLSAEQARHLTEHGLARNEDGSYGWKYDNYTRAITPFDMTGEELRALWSRIECPTLLVEGSESWAADPDIDASLQLFQDARVARFEDAGHWVHHDRLDAFVDETRRFIAA